MNRKRQIAAAAAVLLSAASVRGLLAEEPENFRYIVNTAGTGDSGLPGAVYAVYLDPECLKPLLDDTGCPEEITSGSDGRAEFAADEDSLFLKEKQAPAGYYRNAECMQIDAGETAVVPHEPVIVETELTDSCTAVLKETDTGQVLASWKDGKWMQEDQSEYVFLSNVSYAVKQADEPWIFYPEQTVNIPDIYDPQNQICIKAPAGQHYGTVHVNLPEEEGFSYDIYTDEEGTVSVKDLTGTAEEENRLRLKEGTYYLRWLSVPDAYWEDSAVCRIEVHNGEQTEVQGNFESPAVSLRACSSEEEGKAVNGSWYLKDQNTGEAFRIDPSESCASAQLKRSHTYSAAFISAGGYYPAEVQTVSVPAEKTELQVSVSCTPITLSLQTVDADSGESLPDVSYALFADNDQLACWSGNTVITGEFLKPGEICRAVATDLPQGYLNPPDVWISIPETDQGTVYAQTEAQPYVHWFLEAAENTAAALYTDAACTETAEDIYGNSMEKVTEAELCNGTYYARICSSDEQWYASRQPVEFHVSREQGIDASTEITMDPVTLETAMKKEDGSFLPGVKCILRDRKGNTVQSWTSSSETVVLQGLKRNSVYDLLVESAPGLYTYTHASMPVVIPMYCPDAAVSAEAVFTPYISLCICGSDGSTAVDNVQYSLYLDENGTEPAEDIRGNKAEGQSDAEGKVWFSVRKGTYWLKAVSRDMHLYGNGQMRKIVLDGSSWSEQVDYLFHTCAFRFLLEDEEGNPVAGAQISLLDENGEQVYSWFTDGSEQYVSGDFLCRGSTYHLQIADVPEGYRKPETEIIFSIPETSADAQLLKMQISGKKKVEEAKTIRTPAATTEPESAAEKEKAGKLPYGWILILAAAGFLLLRIRYEKRYEKRLKEN